MEKELYELLSIMKKVSGNYPNEVFIKEDDGDINDCLIKLYYRLIASNDNPNLNMYEQQFIRSYKKLSDTKKEVVKKDFIKVLNNIKELNEKGEMKL